MTTSAVPGHTQVRPAACSTPDSKQGAGRHGRVRNVAARPKNMREKRACSTPPPSVPGKWVAVEGEGTKRGVLHRGGGSAEDLRLQQVYPPLPPPHQRKTHLHHRKSATESGKVSSLTNLRSASGGLVLPPPLVAGGTNGGNQKPAMGTNTFWKSKQKLAASNAPSAPHLPPPPPPLFHPYYHPYSIPYPPPYPFPYYMQLLPPEWAQESGDWPHPPPPPPSAQPRTQTEALDLATLHNHHHLFNYPRGYPLDYYQGYYRDLLNFHKQSLKTQDQVNPQVLSKPPMGKGGVSDPGSPAQTAEVDDKPLGSAVDTEQPARNLNQVLDVEGLDVLLCELLNSCEERVQGLRKECGEYNMHFLYDKEEKE